MLSNRTAFIALLAFNGLFIIGCSNPKRGGAASGIKDDDPSQPYAKIQFNKAVIIDKSLQDWSNPKNKFLFWDTDESKNNYSRIAVESTNSRRTETGTLVAWAELRNRTDYELKIEARTTFYDASQVKCDGPTAWQRVILAPNSVETYKEYSTKTQEVSYYYIEIREGR